LVKYKISMKIYIIAGEVSGDIYGGLLIRELKTLNPNIEIYGVGGKNMIQAGLDSLFPMQEISVMGFFEILPKIFRISKLIGQTVADILEVKPDLLITIDSPGFNFRVAKRIKKLLPQTKLVHYVAPSVWAYKESRAKTTASIFDHLLTILPFENKYFTPYGLPCNYIGHPILEKELGDEINFRKKYKIRGADKLIAIAPGSRQGEVDRLLPIFMETINLIRRKVDHSLTVVIAGFENLKYENLPSRVMLITDENDKKDLFAAADITLTKSGTITTEIARNNKPMIVAHKINYFSSLFLKFCLRIKYVTIINIIAEDMIIPELLQEDCNPYLICNSLLGLLQNKQAYDKQVRLQKDILEQLQGGRDGLTPSARAARVLLDLK